MDGPPNRLDANKGGRIKLTKLVLHAPMLKAVLELCPKGLPNHSALRETIRPELNVFGCGRPLAPARGECIADVMHADPCLELGCHGQTTANRSSRLLDDRAHNGLRPRAMKQPIFTNKAADKLRIMCGHVCISAAACPSGSNTDAHSSQGLGRPSLRSECGTPWVANWRLQRQQQNLSARRFAGRWLCV